MKKKISENETRLLNEMKKKTTSVFEEFERKSKKDGSWNKPMFPKSFYLKQRIGKIAYFISIKPVSIKTAVIVLVILFLIILILK